jgi:hypothetical protein
MFGLDIKSVLVGIAFAYFLLPLLIGAFNRPTAANKNA